VAADDQSADPPDGKKPVTPRMSALRLRILSAVILAPLVVIVTLIGDAPFAVVVACAGLIMVYEWSKLIDGNGLTQRSALFGAIVILGAVLAGTSSAWLALLGVTVGTAGMAVWARGRGQAVIWPVLGTPYLALPVISLIWLRGHDDAGLRHVIWLLAVVWTTDTAAYAVGRSVRGPKLAPWISPNKTISGFVGGIVAAALVGAVAAKLTQSVDLMNFVVLSAVLAIWAELGDLAESALKRRFRTKDTGSLIPGHGGMLDRLDSLLFAAPLAALWLLLRGEGALP